MKTLEEWDNILNEEEETSSEEGNSNVFKAIQDIESANAFLNSIPDDVMEIKHSSQQTR